MAAHNNKYQVVVRGEASETDSDEELYITSVSSSAHSIAADLKVPGEAPETDSEEEPDDDGQNAQVSAGNTFHSAIPPLVVTKEAKERNAEHCSATKAEQGGRCSTLLEQKLQESNWRLYDDVRHMYRHVHCSASKEIRAATASLSSSQNGIITSSHSIRLILEDLKCVSEKIDIITNCCLLPDIVISTS
ncbi:biogenesis of lysosome-related organelles complex 1 subunit 3-like [Scleropages formosus]|uniref:Biogenesis of lysosome-related organelles complex 1 subunit 3 n=1 Tax=Scleropages formosus TaxID=113540 RepID=A0A0P7WAP0_SCLFO|nr:biogenesis of lysosome-related organelles complex 1 subunit 3 [Scleropages formosus]KPP58034.1 biogenesis of lysosome-related organelles complex 1 subunit 3-like [Scleropages formosus]